MARRAAPAKLPDVAGMKAAVHDFLVAAGLDPASHKDLAQTPTLVAKAWSEEFLDGYQQRPAKILADRFPVEATARGEMVVVTGIDFQSVCPHHLLPYGGVAHVAYLPSRSVVGFGQLVKLVDCLGHRLVLQEDLARQIADALLEELGAAGAGVVLVASQSCLTLRGERRPHARVTAEAFRGALAKNRELRERFLRRISVVKREDE